MKEFTKFEDRIELGNGWISIYRFAPIDENRADVEFVFMSGTKRRREKRIAKKVPNMKNNIWCFQYDGNAIFFEMS